MKDHLRAIVLILATFVSCFAQTIIEVEVPADEVVSLKCDGVGDKHWRTYVPYDLKYKTFESGGVFACMPPKPGDKIVVESQLTNWDERKNIFQKYVIRVKGTPDDKDEDEEQDDEDDEDHDVDPEKIPEGYLGLTRAVGTAKLGSAGKSKINEMISNLEGVIDGLIPGDSQKPSKYGDISQAMKELAELHAETLKNASHAKAWDPVLKAADDIIESKWPLDRIELVEAYKAVAKGMGYLK